MDEFTVGIALHRANIGAPGNAHIVTQQPIHVGKLHREPGDALCRPRASFWCLHEDNHEPPTCPKCLAIFDRLIVTCDMSPYRE